MDQQATSPREDKLLEHLEYKHEKSESSESEDYNGQPREWKCTCSKKYYRQSSLYNHIRMKHKNQKEQFQIKTNSKPGRPKNAEGKDKQQATKKEKKEQNKPWCVSGLDWTIITILAEQFFSELVMVVKSDLNENYDSNARVELPQDCQSFLDEMIQTAQLTTQEAEKLAKITFSFGLLANMIYPKKRLLYFANYVIAEMFVAFDFPSNRSEQSRVLKENANFNDQLFTEFLEIIRDNNDQQQKERQTKVSTEKRVKKHLKRDLEQQQTAAVSAPELEKTDQGSSQEGAEGYQHIANPPIRFYSGQQHLDYSNNIQEIRMHPLPQQYPIESGDSYLHLAQQSDGSSRNPFETHQYNQCLKTNELQYQNNALPYSEQQQYYTSQQNHQPNPQALHPNPISAQTYPQYSFHSDPPAYPQQQQAQVQRIGAQYNIALNIADQDTFSQNNNKVESNLVGEDNMLSTPCQNGNYQESFQANPVQSGETFEESNYFNQKNGNINVANHDDDDDNNNILQSGHNQLFNEVQNHSNNKEEHSKYYGDYGNNDDNDEDDDDEDEEDESESENGILSEPLDD